MRIYLFILLSITILGCTKPSENLIDSSGNAESQLKKIRIMGHWYGEGKKEMIVREAVREFSLLNQEYYVQLEFPNHIFTGVEESQLFHSEIDTIVRMIQTNVWPWDVLFCDQERYKKVAEVVGDPNWGQKYLVDFSGHSWFNEAHKDGLLSNMNFKSIYGQIIPGTILEGITNILYVSEKMEQKTGVKVKDLDMTSDDLLQYAKAVAQYNSTHTDKVTFFSTQLRNAAELLFTQLVLSGYGKAEPNQRQKGLEALSEVYKFFEQLSVYKPLEQHIDYSGMLYDKAQRILEHEKCLFTMQPSWMYLLWENSNPEGAKQMRPTEIPSMKNGMSKFYVGFYQVIFVVPKNAQNSEAASKFITHISNSEIADKWINYSKCPTGLKSNISYTDFGQDNFDIFFRHIQKKYGNNQIDVDLGNYLFNSKKRIEFKVEDVLKGTMSANAAMNNVINQLQ